MDDNYVSQLPDKFHGHFSTPLEYAISLIRRSLACVHLLKSYLSDTDNIAPFKNTHSD